MVGAKTTQIRKSKTLNRVRARKMRHEATDAEKKFWLAVRDHRLRGHKFKRQVLIGKFIADFACLEGRLIIELDGGQHRAEKDAGRDAALYEHGFRIIRFWNNDVLTNLEAVLEKVLAELNTPSP